VQVEILIQLQQIFSWLKAPTIKQASDIILFKILLEDNSDTLLEDNPLFWAYELRVDASKIEFECLVPFCMLILTNLPSKQIILCFCCSIHLFFYIACISLLMSQQRPDWMPDW
ncbi:hypothetical protein ACJX0J_041663, partial [Zea mays]